MQKKLIKALETILIDGLTRVQNWADFYSLYEYETLDTIFDLAHRLKKDYPDLDLSDFYTEYHRVYCHLIRLEEKQRVYLDEFRKYEYIPWN